MFSCRQIISESQFELVTPFALQISQLLPHLFQVAVQHLLHGLFLPRSLDFFPQLFDDLQAGLVEVVDESSVLGSLFFLLFGHHLALGFHFFFELLYLCVQQDYLLAPLSLDALNLLFFTLGKLALFGFDLYNIGLILGLLLFEILVLP